MAPIFTGSDDVGVGVGVPTAAGVDVVVVSGENVVGGISTCLPPLQAAIIDPSMTSARNRVADLTQQVLFRPDMTIHPLFSIMPLGSHRVIELKENISSSSYKINCYCTRIT